MSQINTFWKWLRKSTIKLVNLAALNIYEYLAFRWNLTRKNTNPIFCLTQLALHHTTHRQLLTSRNYAKNSNARRPVLASPNWARRNCRTHWTKPRTKSIICKSVWRRVRPRCVVWRWRRRNQCTNSRVCNRNWTRHLGRRHAFRKSAKRRVWTWTVCAIRPKRHR